MHRLMGMSVSDLMGIGATTDASVAGAGRTSEGACPLNPQPVSIVDERWGGGFALSVDASLLLEPVQHVEGFPDGAP